LYYSLPVYKQVYDLILKVFEVTKDFSKEYKYTLGQDMKGQNGCGHGNSQGRFCLKKIPTLLLFILY
jgi:hypothetical protein